MDMIRDWVRRTMSNRQLVVLGLFIACGVVTIFYLGDILAPVLFSLVLAYLLEPAVTRLQKWYVPRWLGAVCLLIVLVTLLVLAIIWLSSHISAITGVANNVLSGIDIAAIKSWLMAQLESSDVLQLFLSEATINEIDQEAITTQINDLRSSLNIDPKTIVSNFMDLGGQAVYFAVMVLLIPVMAFFMIKDKQALIDWGQQYLPQDRGLANHVWAEVDAQIGNYIRGKFIEMVVVGFVTTLLFWYFGLNNYVIFGMLVGISVLVPYVGSIVVTVPIFCIAVMDEDIGWSATLLWFMLLYVIIQVLDGQLLVPLIFSEAMSMHPLAIIISVLFFGGLWGFWGAFFAIPLAVLVYAIIKAWPREKRAQDSPSADATALDASSLNDEST